MNDGFLDVYEPGFIALHENRRFPQFCLTFNVQHFNYMDCFLNCYRCELSITYSIKYICQKSVLDLFKYLYVLDLCDTLS